MDLSLLSTPSNNYDKQRTGALFTIRPANSPSYSLSRRHGVRKSKDVLEEVRESYDGSGNRVAYGARTGTSFTQTDRAFANSYSSIRGEENKTVGLDMSARLSQARSADKTWEEFGTDRSGNCNLAPERRGRTDWIRREVSNRSRSLDWRRGERSPDRSRRADLLRIEEDLRKNTDTRNEGTSIGQGIRGRCSRSSVGSNSNSGLEDQKKNQISEESMFLNRPSRGNSLPSRVRSNSGTTSELRGTTAVSGPKGSQSILERIERLYGSAGVSKTDSLGGTFPRRLSAGDKSPAQRKKWFTWTQKDAQSLETSPTLAASKTDDGVPKVQWHRESLDQVSEDRGINSRILLKDIGTRSLDRARSKFTVAVQIRAARANERLTPTLDTNFSGEKEEPYSSIGLRKEQRNWNRGEENANKIEFRSNSQDEDVFDLNLPKKQVQTLERKTIPERLPVTSSASVKNKINQFEALTQRTQSQVLPRRTFSVPTQLSSAHNGVKKSGSERAIGGMRDKWTGTTNVKTTAGSGRSFSVDEVGLRLDIKEKDGTTDKEQKEYERGHDFDLNHYTRLKDTLELPLNSKEQGLQKGFYIDEADFLKTLSPEDASKRPLRSTLSNSSDTSCGLHKAAPLIVDEDKTPTNTPTVLPSVEFAILNEKNRNESPTSLPPAETEKSDSLPPCLPLTTWAVSSMASTPDTNTSIKNIEKKSMLDLSAWVADVNPKVKLWDDEEEDSDDDRSTQRDEDSNYDSDSGESSVTITSNISQSDNKSFSVSFSDLCNFAGIEYESENESDNWQTATRRSASLSSDMSAFSCVSVMPAEELDKLLDDVKSLGDSNLQDYNDVQVVVLHKDVGVGLGFSLAGGVDQNKPVTVHKVFPSGVAAQEGSIEEGQQVLSINGSSLSDSLHWEALRVLRRAKTRNMGVVVLRKGGTFSTPKDRGHKRSPGTTPAQSGESGEQMCVRLEKNDRDLGFSLEGGVGSSLEDRPLIVQKVFQGGPVDKVFPGDEVLEIEGVSMMGKRRLDAWSLIRKLPAGPVDVVICRPVKVQNT